MIKTVKRVFLAFAISVVTGLVCGMAGILFHKSIEVVTEIRDEYPFLIYLLPVAGIIIAAMYTYAKKYGSLNTMRVVSAIKDGKDVPFIMAPLIFVSSCISHLCGASVGREGAALQLGGSIGYKIGTLFKLPKEVKKFMAPVGMSAVFSAVFGTPLTASVFVVEAAGFPNILILLCTLVSSFAAFFTSLLLGVAPVRFNIPGNNEYTLKFILAVVIKTSGGMSVSRVKTRKTLLMIGFSQDAYDDILTYKLKTGDSQTARKKTMMK
jgi:H+/Cl- antiporter ClcA